ncbi:MAG: aryl-sulfate sulfotransferase [Mycoplasmatales bacterium]
MSVEKDSNKYDEIMNDNWIINSNMMAYDKVGDLRMYGLADGYNWITNFTKIINDKLIIGDTDIDGIYYTSYLYDVDLMGRIKNQIVAPKGYGFHHDGVSDGENYYFLGNDENSKSTKYKESLIFKYDKNFNYKKTYDIGSLFTGEEEVLMNSTKDDIHLNSIDYLQAENQLVLSSRSTSDIYSYDLDTNKIEWIVGNQTKETNEEFKEKYLTIKNLNELEYTSGQHSAFIAKTASVS